MGIGAASVTSAGHYNPHATEDKYEIERGETHWGLDIGVREYWAADLWLMSKRLKGAEMKTPLGVDSRLRQALSQRADTRLNLITDKVDRRPRMKRSEGLGNRRKYPEIAQV